jgi:hypothetical protein
MKLFLFLLFFILNGCDSMYNKNVVGNFYLTAVESLDDACLVYHEHKSNSYPAIIAYGIFSVQYNSEYIIVKKHPFLNTQSRLRFDMNVTEFYIVKNVHTDFFDDKNCLGPFNEETFLRKIKELNICNLIEFRINK